MSALPVDVISVPYDGYGRAGHQAAAAASYERAGLLHHPSLRLRDAPLPRQLPAFSAERGALTGLVNEDALFATVDLVRDAVAASLAGGHVPLVVGGDCSLLLGTFAGALTADPDLGLLFIDGHEDTTPLDVVEDGEAANTELGLLLGLTGRHPSFPRPDLLGVLPAERLAAVGMRDKELRRAMNVGSVRDQGAFTRTARQVCYDPEGAARTAVRAGAGGSWWMHVDLDVLDPTALPATLVPGESEGQPGGLTWSDLGLLMTTAAAVGGCRGLSVAIYDPEQDPEQRYAPMIVDLVHRTLEAMPASDLSSP